MLRVVYSNTPRKLKGAMGYDPVTGHGFGPKGRIEKLRQIVTSLIRHERLEGSFGYLDETRGYVELLIQRAQKHGPHHKETMELADYWLNEKDLIPKLFEVLAPRYAKYETSFTHMYRLPTKYPGGGKLLAILELKGNPYPPVIPKQRDKRGLLTNILLEEMRKDYYRDKYQKQPPPPAAASENTEAEIKRSTTDSNDSSESKDSSMESENYHKDAHLSVKAPNVDGTPV